MGARMYVVKENEDGSFTAVYDHWGVDALKQLAGRFSPYEEIYSKLLDIWEKGREKSKEDLVELKSIEEVYKFIDFERTDIEVYAVVLKDGSIEFFVTLQNGFISGAIRKRIGKYDSGYELLKAFRGENKYNAIIEFLEAINYDIEKAKKDIVEAYGKMEFKPNDFELIIAKNLDEAIKTYRTYPLRSMGIILY